MPEVISFESFKNAPPPPPAANAEPPPPKQDAEPNEKQLVLEAAQQFLSRDNNYKKFAIIAVSQADNQDEAASFFAAPSCTPRDLAYMSKLMDIFFLRALHAQSAASPPPT